jgi:hypothetical protein
VKYYIYVSDTKVDMLFPQIQKGLRSKIAAELKVNLKLLELTIGGKNTPETRYSKLDIINSYIRKSRDLGTVEEPKAYFEGTLPMCWGPYGHGSRQIVYFGGETERAILGLGGSLDHIIGNNRGTESPPSTQVAYFVLDALNDWDKPSPGRLVAIEKTQSSLNAIVMATKNIMRQGPTQELEFVARRLVQGQSEGKSVLLGSPLYVALAD